MRFNLAQMSVKELTALRTRVDDAIAKQKNRNRKDALAKLKAVASETGFSLEELLGEGGAKRGRKAKSADGRRRPVPAKYAHPTEPGLTWTGRGRTPKWVEALEKSGKSRDSLLIRAN